jgi:hypothetical protein
VRDDLGPASHDASHWSILNRSARPYFASIRGVVEEWFSRYPANAASHLSSRLRSRDNVLHTAAFFELYLHELLLRLGCIVAVEPPLSSGTRRRPDFLACTPDGGSFYLEAAVAHTDTPEKRAEQAILAKLYDGLNRLETTDYFLDVQMRGAPTASVRVGDIRRRLSSLLAGLDFDMLRSDFEAGNIATAPTWPFEFRGGSLIIRPLPRGPETKGRADARPIGIYPVKASWVDGQTYLRRSLSNKAGRYGDLGVPFIVAVDALADRPDQEDIEVVLFRESDRNGRPIAKGLLSPIRHRQLSGVFVTAGLSSASFPYCTGQLWLNPWTKYRYPSILEQLPRAELIDGSLAMHGGQTLNALLGTSVEQLAER